MPIPYPFVLDYLEPLSPTTRSMFGTLAVYVGEKIVFLLRDKPDQTLENGVWIATKPKHHASLRLLLPSLRSIRVLGKVVAGWQVIPRDAPDFEKTAIVTCELVVMQDPRIGKVSKIKRRSRRNVKKL